MFASGCAAARAFHDYCRKTKIIVGKLKELKEQKKTTITATVEFLIVSDNNGDNKVDKEELATLERIANAIKMTARIVDTPCNDMNVNNFLDASQTKWLNLIHGRLLISDTTFRK